MGNVGIGVTNPSVALEVAGTITKTSLSFKIQQKNVKMTPQKMLFFPCFQCYFYHIFNTIFYHIFNTIFTIYSKKNLRYSHIFKIFRIDL